MSVPFWVSEQTANGSLWDFIWLGGVLWPGIWTVDIKKARSIDQAKAKGKDGISLTDNGYKAAPVNATGLLWLAKHLSDLEEILPNFDPETVGQARGALDIYHPAAQLLGIKQVYLEEIGTSNPVKGVLKVSLSMIQWFPSTKTFGTKPLKGFDGTAKSGAKLDARDFSVPKPSADTGSKL